MSLRLSGGRRLQSPPGQTARPTTSRVRLAVMNLLAEALPGCRWLDLCCGSGVMACEALQRGAAVVVAVDRDRRLVALARTNLEAVRKGSSHNPALKVHGSDVLHWLARGRGELPPFDLIYVDPPYGAGLYGPIAAGVTAGQWLRPGGTMVWECASNAIPAVPAGWHCRDQRRYGGCSLLLLEPQGLPGPPAVA